MMLSNLKIDSDVASKENEKRITELHQILKSAGVSYVQEVRF